MDTLHPIHSLLAEQMFDNVKCPCCEEDVPRHALPSHQATCYAQMTRCSEPDCSWSGPRCTRQEHILSCPIRKRNTWVHAVMRSMAAQTQHSNERIAVLESEAVATRMHFARMQRLCDGGVSGRSKKSSGNTDLVAQASDAVRLAFMLRARVDDSTAFSSELIQNLLRRDLDELHRFTRSDACYTLFNKQEWLGVACELLSSMLLACASIMPALIGIAQRPQMLDLQDANVASEIFTRLCVCLREMELRAIGLAGADACFHNQQCYSSMAGHIMTIVYALIQAIEPPQSVVPAGMTSIKFEHICLFLIHDMTFLCSTANKMLVFNASGGSGGLETDRSQTAGHVYDGPDVYSRGSCMAIDVVRTMSLNRAVDTQKHCSACVPLFERHASVCRRLLHRLLQQDGIVTDNDIFMGIIQQTISSGWFSSLLCGSNDVCLDTCAECCDVLLLVFRTIKRYTVTEREQQSAAYAACVSLSNKALSCIHDHDGIESLTASLVRQNSPVSDGVSVQKVSLSSQQALSALLDTHRILSSTGSYNADLRDKGYTQLLNENDLVAIGVSVMQRICAVHTRLSLSQRNDLLHMLLVVFESGYTWRVIESSAPASATQCSSNLLIGFQSIPMSAARADDDDGRLPKSSRSARRVETLRFARSAALTCALALHLACNSYSSQSARADVLKRLSPLADKLGTLLSNKRVANVLTPDGCLPERESQMDHGLRLKPFKLVRKLQSTLLGLAEEVADGV